MELGQQGSSETSSEETGRKEQVKLDDTSTTTNNTSTTTTTKRFYECTFCKKGFDNAQALGGHMNIHRGAKAKAKQVATSSPPIRSNEEYFKPTYMAPISSEPPRMSFYPVPEARSNCHNMYFQPSGSCPRQPYAHNYQFGTDFLLPRPRSLSINNEELCGSNLSLQIGSDQAQENEITMGDAKEDEVDLELRLGHHDRY